MVTKKFILKKAYQIVEKDLPLVQLYYLTPFSKPIYLQIILQGERIDIVKSILKEKQIHVQSGNWSGPETKKINQLIESLEINFRLEKNFSIGRDGYHAELTISGRKFQSITFSWDENSMPDEWKDLTPLLDVLLEINDKVKYTDTCIIKYEVLLDDDSNSMIRSNNKSVLLEYKEIQLKTEE